MWKCLEGRNQSMGSMTESKFIKWVVAVAPSLSHVQLFVTHGLQHARLPCPSQLPELTQTHVHWVGDAIQPSHPLSFPSPPTFNPSQHQGLFQWVNSLHQVEKVLEFQLQHQYIQWIFRNDFLQDWLVWSPCSSRDSWESSPTPQFKSINSLVLSFLYMSNSHIHTWLVKNHSFD